jgi:hypothetical protein
MDNWIYEGITIGKNRNMSKLLRDSSVGSTSGSGFCETTLEYLINNSLVFLDIDDKLTGLRPINITDIDTFFLKSLGKIRVWYWIKKGELRDYETDMEEYTKTKRMLSLRKLGI